MSTKSVAGAAFVILAAGKGTRMRSALPKVLHLVAGLPMLGHGLRLAEAVDAARVVVVAGHEAEQVSAAAERMAAAPERLRCVLQAPQRGTAHAVAQAREALRDFSGQVFVLFGDTPLITPQTIGRLSAALSGAEPQAAAPAGVAVLGFEPADPGPYGRLILEPGGRGGLARIVEAKDASPEELAMTPELQSVTA
ncbi:MAG: NTP transferase domain-containing protein, partial [Pseudomonadota bacterium]